MDESRHQNQRLHHAAIAAHARDPIDNAWARPTAQKLEDDLQHASASGGFQLKDVECRTSTCVARVDFPNYSQARMKWPHLLHAPIRPRCGVDVMLDDAEDPAAPFETSVVYNCLSDRAN